MNAMCKESKVNEGISFEIHLTSSIHSWSHYFLELLSGFRVAIHPH